MPGTDDLRVVLYESRPAALIGVKLAVLSLARHCPGLEVAVTVPGAPPAFVEWLASQPHARHHPLDLELSGWNVKPALLLAHLDEHPGPVAWIDSDVILHDDIRTRLARLPDGAAVVAEDVWYAGRAGTWERTDAWGLERGRLLPFVTNTAFLLVGARHRPLLAEWDRLLHHPGYQSAQDGDYHTRPLHQVGDQDVLSALLGAAAWRDLSVGVLRRGTDIVHCVDAASISPRERLLLRRSEPGPALIHGAGPKPWAPGDRATAAQLRHVGRSLYSWAAAGYRDALPGELDWAPVDAPAAPPVLAELGASVTEGASMGARQLAGRLRRRLGG